VKVACDQFCICEKTLPRLVSVREDAGRYGMERCWWCGTPFPPRGPKVYCSRYCLRAAWYVLHPNANRESSSRFREKSPERAKELSRAAYIRHAEGRRAASARWAKANRVRKSAAEQRRRAAKLGLETAVDPAAWAAIVAAAQGRCAYCGLEAPLTMDHRIPLSRSGTHEIENLIPACKPCNSRKHTRTEEEFRAYLREERDRGIGESEASYGASRWSPSLGTDVRNQNIAFSLLDERAA